MSLLLDALKKAAEQKAAKSRADITQVEESDETLVVSPAEDISELANANTGLRRSPVESADETVVDQTEFQEHTNVEATEMQDFTDVDVTEMQTRLDNTHIDSDEVDSEVAEVTSTRIDATQQMQTGEDETIVFETEDVSDFMGEPQLVSREREDETEQVPVEPDVTDVSQLTRVDVTEADVTQFDGATSTGDDTDMSQPFRPGDQVPEDQTDFTAQLGAGDETDFTEQVAAADETDFTAEVRDRDESESTTLLGGEDKTDISQPVTRADEVRPASPGEAANLRDAAAEHLDETEMDEDMSLLLVENEVTNLTALTNPKDPREIPGVDDLSLVDTTRHRFPNEAGSATQTSATTDIGQNTQTRSAATQTQATSTLTYAPDNYDRTLMKLPSEDASKIFAGMKSDSDVVMTPDYAKKVFRSKSSEQRMLHYRLYAGIAAMILIGIFIFGLFEFTSESDNIDASLRLLKRDPMPGVIQQAGQVESQNLFAGAESGADERTIEIIESADSVATEGAITGTVEAGEAGAESEPPTVEPEGVVASVDTTKTRAVETASAVSSSPESAGSSQLEAVEIETANASSNLQVSSSTQVRETDTLLREAYAAYRSGDDELAMTRYNEVLKLDPANRNALLARAAINVQNNNSAEAIRDYRALLLANPKDSLAMTSFISVASISPRDSETQLKLMIQDEPESPYLNFALANAYSAQNRWPEAQGYYFRALQNNPGDPNYAYNLAVSLEHISQPASAISYYRRALDNFENGLATFSRDVVSQRMELLAKK